MTRLVLASGILVVTLLLGIIIGITTPDGTADLPIERQATAAQVIADAKVSLEPIERIVNLGVRVISITDDADCRRLDVGNDGFRIVVELYSLFGIGYQRAVACAGGIDTTPFR